MSLSIYRGPVLLSQPAGPSRLTSRGLAQAVAETIPALLLIYLFLLWPVAFGDSTESVAETALGWLAAPASKDESPLKLIAYPILFGLGLICFLISGGYRRIPWLNGGVLLVLAFLALAVLSTVWSLFPGLTLRRAALLVLTTSIVLFAAFSAGSFKNLLGRMFWVLFVVTLVNIPAVVVNDATPIGHSGIYPHKNVFGYVAFLILIFGLRGLFTGRLFERLASVPMVVASIAFLWVSQSKTSLGLTLISPPVGAGLFLMARYFRWSPAVTFGGFALFCGGFFWAGVEAELWTFFEFNELVFGNATLTGRTDVWSHALDWIGQRPFFGYGYEAVWATGPDGLANRNAVGFTRVSPTGHNGFIDIMLYTGTVGLVLVVAATLVALAQAGRLAGTHGGNCWLVLSITVFCILHNLLESDLLISSHPLSMITLLLLFCAVRANESERAVSPGRLHPRQRRGA